MGGFQGARGKWLITSTGRQNVVYIRRQGPFSILCYDPNTKEYIVDNDSQNASVCTDENGDRLENGLELRQIEELARLFDAQQDPTAPSFLMTPNLPPLAQTFLGQKTSHLSENYLETPDFYHDPLLDNLSENYLETPHDQS